MYPPRPRSALRWIPAQVAALDFGVGSTCSWRRALLAAFVEEMIPVLVLRSVLLAFRFFFLFFYVIFSFK